MSAKLDINPPQLMDALQRFNHDFNQTINAAVQANVPLENLILQLDLAHTDLILLRKRVIAEQTARDMASKIVPASQMPPGK
jgi:hypothetical protein